MLHLDGVGASSALVAEHGGEQAEAGGGVNAGLEEEPAPRAVRRTVGEASSGTTATGARCSNPGSVGGSTSIAARFDGRCELEGGALELVGLGADPGGDAGERGLVPGAAELSL